MLGPSGSGKTTCLMMLAGFEAATHGEIYLAGQPINQVPPYRRDIGMVFQNYALFPHMTVGENVAFPLQVRGIPKPDVAARVTRALDMVQLGAFANRRPAQLSGGQQQRVALARALVFEPKLILMDEPLGALDKQLRETMQYEIKHLHRQARPDRGLRHPRPGRGADHVRPGRRVQRGADPAAGDTRPALRGAEQRLRGAVHRREQPAARPGPLGRRAALRRRGRGRRRSRAGGECRRAGLRQPRSRCGRNG